MPQGNLWDPRKEHSRQQKSQFEGPKTCPSCLGKSKSSSVAGPREARGKSSTKR